MKKKTLRSYIGPQSRAFVNCAAIYKKTYDKEKCCDYVIKHIFLIYLLMLENS